MDRRPIKSRSAGWAQTAARWIARLGISPNQVSVFSMLGGALACGAFVASTDPAGKRWAWLLLAVVGIQFRLVCNLIDGMVAMEHGKKTATGALFNDVPDRVSDTLIIGGAALAVATQPYAISLGWAAVVLALLSAYIRMLGGALGTPQFFLGPMAKPHRMAIISGAALFDAAVHASSLTVLPVPMVYGALWVLVGGTMVTCYRRLAAISQALQTAEVSAS